MAFGSGKKPANQGSAGKAPTQGIKKSANPSPAKPGKSTILFGHRTEGIGGKK